ncbi:lytic transglycosylase domain-containing protein [Acidisphaera sp. L21]|uniref:lytic transglycosylase domain-containing protein n=1 Tax=Acidisphaera sp. L21 TaxID=1641851 RepID=UPI00131C079B|nr:lytic transglycosylase domain-containing protein [Acidisphaera sp. L21]
MKRFVLIVGALLAAVPFNGADARALAQPAASIPAPSALCRAAILQAERGGHVPDRLLDAIAVVESGKRDPVSGAVYPWPWTINAEGVGHWYDSKAEAIAAVQALQARGVRSIDVGCMQVNLMHHADAFSSLDAAFDPMINAAYAAKFLQQLFNQTNAWPLAAAAYHSFTPDVGADYARKVLAAWGVPQLPVGAQAVTAGTARAPGVPAPMQMAQAGAGMPGSIAGGAGGRVAVMLPMGHEAPRTMALGGNIPAGRGAMPVMAMRGLDAYRAMPISFAARPTGRF